MTIPSWAISNSLTSEDREKIKQGKIMELVFEITDGGSSRPENARDLVDQMTELGVIARAFQIGSVSDGEKKTLIKFGTMNAIAIWVKLWVIKLPIDCQRLPPYLSNR